MSEAGDGWWNTLDERTPGVPVWVSLRMAMPPQSVGVQRGTPMRVRAAGVDVGRQAPGLLVAWQYSCTGDLWAEVHDVVLTNRNGKASRHVSMIVPAAAVTPRELSGAAGERS